MKREYTFFALLLVSALLSLNCSPQFTPSPQVPTATRGQLTPYTLPPPSQTPTLIPVVTSTQEALLPTSTPFTYKIQEGDTLYGIALRFDTTVDKIIAANPDLSSNILSPGNTLVIPSGEEGSIPDLPTATPIPLPLSDPVCYPANEGGLWCFVSVFNDQDILLENISAVINLYEKTGELAASRIALPPINILNKGDQIPLSAYFPPPTPETYRVFASLLTALPSAVEAKPLPIEDQDITYREDRHLAMITGKVNLENVDQTMFQEIWVIGIAFDGEGEVAGIRKWVSDKGLSSPDLQSVSFQFNVYSLGPPIAEIKLITEHY
ncbi:MAG: LysM peptidoglycan-binding domain-containing protein [Anaerolineales bacterium]